MPSPGHLYDLEVVNRGSGDSATIRVRDTEAHMSVTPAEKIPEELTNRPAESTVVRHSIWSFLVALLLVAFALNWLWEMMQMPTYREMAGRPWRETLKICTVATLGDVLITFAVFGVGALAAGQLRWATTGRWNVYATVALLGGACAAVIEWRALISGRWSYTERMPIVPILEVGLWPFLQLVLLIPATFLVAAWWSKRF